MLSPLQFFILSYTCVCTSFAAESQGYSLVLEELMKMNGHLSSLMKDMKTTVQRVKALEDRMDASTTTSNNSASLKATSRTRTVPLTVRVSPTYVYPQCNTPVFTSNIHVILPLSCREKPEKCMGPSWKRMMTLMGG